MPIKLSSLKTDIRKQNDGDWVEIPDLPGVRLKVRGFNYGPYLAAKSIVDGRFQRRYLSKGESVPNDIWYAANARLYLDHILVDWEGLLDDNRNPIPVENAEEFLMEQGYRELHDHIRYAGLKIGEVNAEFVDDAVKN